MPGKALASGRTIARVLDDDRQVADWNRRRRAEAAVAQAIGKALPRPLAAHVAALLPAPDRLELVAPTGTVAAALRQRLPAVLAALGREGMDFRDIRVRVQPVAAPDPRPKSLARQWDNAQEPALKALAGRLPDGPLRSAVQGWLRRSGRLSGR
ncbi:MAG: DciA family protein [Betaproteobacteria bacterium]